jgi:hypothetical protein
MKLSRFLARKTQGKSRAIRGNENRSSFVSAKNMD